MNYLPSLHYNRLAGTEGCLLAGSDDCMKSTCRDNRSDAVPPVDCSAQDATATALLLQELRTSCCVLRDWSPT